MNKNWTSCAEWPADVYTGADGKYITKDASHGTRLQAEGVCKRLGKDGFGGDGKAFPLRTWVEPPELCKCENPRIHRTKPDLGVYSPVACRTCGRPWDVQECNMPQLIKTRGGGLAPLRRAYPKVKRNKPCPCGSVNAKGKPVKFKNCCGAV